MIYQPVEASVQYPIKLKEIAKETVWDILQLTPREEQKQFVASNAESIAEAYFQPNYAWFRGIYAGDCPVGFIMVGMDPKEDFCLLWRLMINAKFQGNHFGKKAIKSLCEYLRSKTNFSILITSFQQGEGDASGFYKKIGFTEAEKRVKQSKIGQHIIESGEVLLQLELHGNSG
jgi:diamine N-acetyltransferase